MPCRILLAVGCMLALSSLACRIDRSGLAGDAGAPARDSASGFDGQGAGGGGGGGGASSVLGSGGAAGMALIGTGGAPAMFGTGGAGGVGGAAPPSAAGGRGGDFGDPGAAGAGGRGPGGAGGGRAPGTGGGNTPGSGGDAGPGSGGTPGQLGSGGVSGPSGTGGTAGSGVGTGGLAGGAGGSAAGGAGGSSSGGAGGIAPNPCRDYPGAHAFVPPDDHEPHCYWFHSDRLPWEDSEDTCDAEGGHLVTITTREENDFVRAVITDFGGGYVSLGGTDDRDPDDTDGPGTYRWITDEPFVFTNWAARGPEGAQEPDGFCDRCGDASCQCDHRLAMTRDGTWNDRWEENPRPFVCESKP